MHKEISLYACGILTSRSERKTIMTQQQVQVQRKAVKLAKRLLAFDAQQRPRMSSARRAGRPPCA